MSLKQVITRKRLNDQSFNREFVLPGEPMIYSVKFSIASRSTSLQGFRDMKWKSILKSNFPSYFKTSVPVVIWVRFYVSPPHYVEISKEELKKESTVAVSAFEICDYLLSFFDMLLHVLLNSYRQIVKIDAEKIYSSNPRTVFKFMKWDQYAKLQARNSRDTKAKSVSAPGKVRNIQSKRKGNVANKKHSQRTNERRKAVKGSSVSGCALPDTSANKPIEKAKRSSKQTASHQAS